MIQYDMLLEQLRRNWYGSSSAYARVAITASCNNRRSILETLGFDRLDRSREFRHCDQQDHQRSNVIYHRYKLQATCYTSISALHTSTEDNADGPRSETMTSVLQDTVQSARRQRLLILVGVVGSGKVCRGDHVTK